MKRTFKPGNYPLRIGKSRTGRGMFAESVIQTGACIIEYTGRPATKKQQKENTGKYLFWTSDTTMIDGNIAQNKARFINHSCRPNSEIDVKNKRIFVFALHPIKPGEELTYNYGEEYFDMYFSHGRCKCPAHRKTI